MYLYLKFEVSLHTIVQMLASFLSLLCYNCGSLQTSDRFQTNEQPKYHHLPTSVIFIHNFTRAILYRLIYIYVFVEAIFMSQQKNVG